MRTYHVYIIASLSRRIYTGVTNNLERRIWEHKRAVVEGFTKRYHINRLVYAEEHRDVRQAIYREKQIKAWRREKKVKLIEATNPRWDDLSAGRYA